METPNNGINKVTWAGILITLGIIYGDIGTSPLYVMSSIIGKDAIDGNIIRGAVSAVFWTLTLQTTIKYVILTLQADNKGEGGIFALFTLVKRNKYKWLIVPAIIGGSALLADGIITPPISVSAAIEGLRFFRPELNTVPIVIGILFGLFFIQQFGTGFIGKFFGPMMTLWFLMLGVLGFSQLLQDASILSSLNPYYAYTLLKLHPSGILILGSVFLCTTGAEALYSDLGHCGRRNIRISWIFVKTMLVLNYFGQGAWLIAHQGEKLEMLKPGNPFYAIMPEAFIPYGIIIATSAAIIASQALISGSFTLINEAMRLNLWLKVRVKYPTESRGQIYIPSINWLLLAGCIMVVFYFRESARMESAYGLAIVLCMLMTTVLLNFYLHMKRYNRFLISVIIIVYLTIELAFLYANLSKFMHGGWITLIIASSLIAVMTAWHLAKKIARRYVDMVKFEDHKQLLIDLSNDDSLQKYATHLVYMTGSNNPEEIEAKIIYSILHKRPKKADVYWFVHVNVLNEPHTMEYKVTHIVDSDIIRIDFNLGFRVAPRINLMFRKVVQDMVKNKEVDITSRYESLNRNNVIGDFKFVVLEKFLSFENDLPAFEKLVMSIYFFLKRFSMSEAKAFGLDSSSLKIEKFPMVITKAKEMHLRRIGLDAHGNQVNTLP
ncbi:MAG: KUP/HAK/KT family potassium transporter [Bacteroidetes bacterium]|nr:KUP/HAK/KT family potassium transporter [Bacteroidota bacterium]